MIDDICKSLCLIVSENLIKSGQKDIPYDGDVLVSIIENEDPRVIDVMNLVDIPVEKLPTALFMSMLYRICPDDWAEGHIKDDPISTKRNMIQTVACSDEAQQRGIKIVNDPFGIDLPKNNKTIPFVTMGNFRKLKWILYTLMFLKH